MKGYLSLYRAEARLPPRTHRKKTGNVTWPPIKEPKDSSLKEHESMSKEDLIDTLVIARINEARPVLFEEYYLRYLSYGSSGSTPRAVWIQALSCCRRLFKWSGDCTVTEMLRFIRNFFPSSLVIRFRLFVRYS